MGIDLEGVDFVRVDLVGVWLGKFGMRLSPTVTFEASPLLVANSIGPNLHQPGLQGKTKLRERV